MCFHTRRDPCFTQSFTLYLGTDLGAIPKVPVWRILDFLRYGKVQVWHMLDIPRYKVQQGMGNSQVPRYRGTTRYGAAPPSECTGRAECIHI